MNEEPKSTPSTDDVWAVRDVPLETPVTEAFPPAEFMPTAGVPATGPRNGLGTASLVVGIVGLVFCWTVLLGVVLGVLGLVFGIIGRARAKRGEATNGGAALAGAITGGLALIGAVAVVVVLVTVVGGPAKNLESCLQNAGNDNAAQQQCDTQFRQQLGG
jgi:hypothetical protein